MEQICSCIGSKVDLYVLGVLIREMNFAEAEGTDIEDDDVLLAETAISIASQEGLLAITKNDKVVVFTHDSVNEAAYFLLDPEQQAQYHLKLGQALHRRVCPNLYHKYLFTIAAQLARGIELITKDDDRITTVSIFLHAGEKSLAASAFPEAHFFFSKGIALLHEEDWTNNYQLCCDIYMKDADTASITGDFHDMDTCLKVLFGHCKGCLVDYLNATYIQVKSFGTRDNPAAIDIGIEALRMAGVKFPSQRLSQHTLVSMFCLYSLYSST